MTDINNVVLVGRLTRDLGTDERSFGYVQSGTARANISIAVNRSRKQGEQWVDETSFFDVTIWGKTAENLKPYLTKGRQVIISGYLKQDRWEKDGQKYSRIGIVADTVQLCGGRDDAGSVNPNKAYNTASDARQADQQYAQQSGQNGQFSQNYAPQNVPQYAPQNATQYAPQNGQQGFAGDGFPENIPF